ncbi:uncharacterized protein LOC129757374 [Uranotaenia lowii]|uniref:uncharacterized protein LOC129757374 n=1 Tax=Uranotaenia lowii TaxID=190385 RepID=UPI0024784CC6|nr:uncharacterized protein LOC129757374 [Uranotaenia lowii]XP_055610554.1 uncharacterized protein LOC129757374 [Uranotaenia lowii]
MTNSHNRSGKNGNYAERYFNNHSPQQLGGGSGGKRHNSTGNNNGNGNRGQKSPSSGYFRSLSTSGAIPIVKSSSPVSNKGGNYYSTSSPSGRNNNSFNLNTSYQRPSPGGGNFNVSLGTYPGMLPGSPPKFSHFAGSKCYDAPAPTALPKPPVHWTTSVSSTASTVAPALNTTTSKTFMNDKATTNLPSSATVGGNRNGPNSSKGSSPTASSSSRSKAKPVKSNMSCAAAVAKANRSVDFTHNLKMVLNVQA